MSEQAKKYKCRDLFKYGAGPYYDSNGRFVEYYRVSEIQYDGKGIKNLSSLNKETLKELFAQYLFKGVEEKIIFEKIDRFKRAVYVNENIGYLIDEHYFWDLDEIGLFPFCNYPDETFCSMLISYFRSKNIEIIELPKTKYSKTTKNYIARIPKDDYMTLGFLSYLMHKYERTYSLAQYGFKSELKAPQINNDDKDTILELIYLVLRKGNSPRHDIEAEVRARCLGSAGWPKPYEFKTEFAMFKLNAMNDGIIKYINYHESILFNLVKSKYSDALYQYFDDWLDSLSLDIYIPSINTAIEFQGGQHYKAVKFYGGKEKLEKIKTNDERKAQLCKEKNVRLIEWPFSLEISEKNLEKMLNQ